MPGYQNKYWSIFTDRNRSLSPRFHAKSASVYGFDAVEELVGRDEVGEADRLFAP